LSAALEGIAFVSRRLAELRRMIGAAMVYPTIVMMLAAWLFLYFIVEVAPKLTAAYSEFSLPLAAPSRLLASFGRHA
jgi:type II secretory pathway component PulF